MMVAGAGQDVKIIEDRHIVVGIIIQPVVIELVIEGPGVGGSFRRGL